MYSTVTSNAILSCDNCAVFFFSLNQRDYRANLHIYIMTLALSSEMYLLLWHILVPFAASELSGGGAARPSHETRAPSPNFGRDGIKSPADESLDFPKFFVRRTLEEVRCHDSVG